MEKFDFEVIRTYRYRVPIEATDYYDALEIIRDFEIEDLEPFEVDAKFDFELV